MRWLCCCHFSNRRVQPYNPPPGQPVPGAPWGSQLYGSDCHFIILFLNAFHSTVLTVCPTPPLFWIKQTMNQPSMIILGCIIYTYIYIYTYLVYNMCCIYIYTYIWRYIIYPYIYSIVSRVFMLCSKNVYVYNCIYIYVYIERERFVDSYTLESANLTLVHCVKFSLVTSCLASENNGDLGDQSPQPLDHGRVANCWSFIKKSLFGVMKKLGVQDMPW